ncbi:hypothetical protein EJB05_13455, partial [Eragrostis curvula]
MAPRGSNFIEEANQVSSKPDAWLLVGGGQFSFTRQGNEERMCAMAAKSKCGDDVNPAHLGLLPSLRHPHASLPAAALPRRAGRPANPVGSCNITSERGRQLTPASGPPGPRLGLGSAGEGGEAGMCDLVARTGRHLQRYEGGRRLLAGCVGRGRPPSPITNHYHSPLYLLASPTTKGVAFLSSVRSGWIGADSIPFFVVVVVV